MKIETAVLKRLGPIPFWRGEEKCLDALENAYRKAMASACQRLAHGSTAVPIRSDNCATSYSADVQSDGEMV